MTGWLWDVWQAFIHATGTDAGPTWPYGFWSGFAGDLTIFTAAVALYRHRNCHARWCWRIGRHPVEGTPYVTCRRHHPVIPARAVTVDHIHAAHRAARAKENP